MSVLVFRGPEHVNARTSALLPEAIIGFKTLGFRVEGLG